MTRKDKNIILLLCFIFSFGFISGQSILQVEKFTQNNGLSNNSITSLYLDSKGFLWVGTLNGLNRFDGSEFLTYKELVNDTSSLSSDYINCIVEDIESDLYLSTPAGINKFRRTQGVFESISSKKILGNVKTQYIHRDILIDQKNNLWGLSENSLDKYDDYNKKFLQYKFKSIDVISSAQHCNNRILNINKNILFVGSGNFLYLLKENQHKPELIKTGIKENQLIKDLYFDGNRIWLVYGNKLQKINPSNFKTENVFSFKNFRTQNTEFNVILQSDDSTLLIGTNKGLVKFDKQKQNFRPSAILDYINKQIQYPSIENMLVDNSGNLWIGTINGLFKANLSSTLFNKYVYDNKGDFFFGTNKITALSDLGHGNVLVGTSNGLYRFNKRSRTAERVERFPALEIITLYKVNELVFVGTAKGLYTYHIKKKKFNSVTSKFSISNPIVFQTYQFHNVQLDKSGVLWFASSNGLYFTNGTNIEKFKFSGKNKELDRQLTNFIIKDNFFLIGTKSGLKIFSKYLNDFVDLSSLGKIHANEVNCIRISPTNQIWLGTTGGLYVLNKEFKLLRSYNENGLAKADIRSLEFDAFGSCWVSTDRGIFRIGIKDGLITDFNQHDNLQGDEFGRRASCKLNNGELFFGGEFGLNSFYPDYIFVNNVKPQVAISAIEIAYADGKTETIYHETESIDVPFNFKSLKIKYSALDFSQYQKNLYKYQFINDQAKWIDLGTEREVTFLKLGPGEHIFNVIASNNSNVWNEEGAKLSIRVIIPLHRTKTAMIVFISLVILLISYFTYIKIKDNRKTSRLLVQQQKVLQELKFQQEELIVKNTSINDSLNYAKRIQEAIMPSYNMFQSILPDSFIFYQPKDIVSGDFYWVNETSNKIFVAVVDCTGHGVPGAFMSIIGIELLRNITNLKGMNDAAEILNELNKGIGTIFSTDHENGPMVKDGMDVSFVVLDKENNKLQFSGALSVLYLLRDDKIIELKGERFAVGLASDSTDQVYKNYNIDLHENDMIYLFSDGYADQFGGPNGKKYKYRRFRQLLLNIHKMTPNMQYAHIKDSFEEWKGEEEQVDDILVIGIRPDLSCMF